MTAGQSVVALLSDVWWIHDGNILTPPRQFGLEKKYETF